MKIAVHDTLTAMRVLLAAPLEQRPDLLRQMLLPIDALYRMPGAPTADVVALHHQGNGFRVDRDRDLPDYSAALDHLERVDALGQVERCLHEAVAHQLAATPDLALPDRLDAVLVLGDPSDAFFTDVVAGYYGMGSRPGCLLLIVWPLPRNEHEIGHLAVHELHHSLRYANVVWDPATVTVGEQVIAEGLAEAFVRELYGPSALSPYPRAARGDEAAYQKVLANLDLQGMHNLSPYVHGDETTKRFGGTPVGLPTGAGYVAGLRLVDAHLGATGLTVAQSTALPSAQIVANALAVD